MGQPTLSSSHPNRRRSILRGRNDELNDLLEPLTDHTADGSILIVKGVDGAGKTRMLEEVRAVAERMAITSLAATHQDLRPDRLRPLAADGPTLVVIDDADLGDPALGTALLTLPEALAGEAITWLAAFNPRRAQADPRLASLHHSLATEATVLIDLPPLAPDAVATVVRDELRETPGWALTIAETAQGQPRLLLELLSDLTHGREAPRVAVERRLRRLSVSARGLVYAASTLDAHFTLDELGDLIGLTEDLLKAVACEAAQDDLLLIGTSTLAFRHNLIRDVIRSSLPSALRIGLGRHAADVLMKHGASATAVAPILAEAAQPGDARAAEVLRSATRALLAADHSRAAEFGHRALQLDATAAEPEFVACVLRSLWRVGRVAEARQLAEQLIESVPAPGADGIIRVAVARCATHDLSGVTTAQLSEDPAFDELPDALRAQLLADTALGLSVSGPGSAADQAIARARAASDGIPRGAAIATTLLAQSVRTYPRNVDRAAHAMNAALAILRTGAGNDVDHGFGALWEAMMLGVADRLEDALSATTRTIETIECDDHVRQTRAWRAVRAHVLVELGRLSDARSEAETVIAMDAGSVGTDAVVARMWYVLFRVATYTADSLTRDRCLSRAEQMRAGPLPCSRRIGSWTAALAASADGRHYDALALAADAFTALQHGDPPITLAQSPFEDVAMARLALDAGAHEPAEAVLCDLCSRRARSPAIPVLAAASLHVEGLVNGSERALSAAADLYRSRSRPIAQAVALEDLGALLSEERPDDAIPHLTAALELFQHVGATSAGARVRARLRLLGVMRRQPSRDPTGPQGLSLTERAVADLIVLGASDRLIAEKLFISRHTVRTHVTHVFEKLGVNSRVEIISQLGRD